MIQPHARAQAQRRDASAAGVVDVGAAVSVIVVVAAPVVVACAVVQGAAVSVVAGAAGGAAVIVPIVVAAATTNAAAAEAATTAAAKTAALEEQLAAEQEAVNADRRLVPAASCFISDAAAAGCGAGSGAPGSTLLKKECSCELKRIKVICGRWRGSQRSSQAGGGKVRHPLLTNQRWAAKSCARPDRSWAPTFAAADMGEETDPAPVTACWSVLWPSAVLGLSAPCSTCRTQRRC